MASVSTRVVDLGAGAVGVDVADVLPGQAGVLERALDAGDGAAAFGMAVGHAEGVGGRAVAGHFGVDAGAAALGVLQLFEHQHAGPFAQDEAVAVQIERPRRLLRVLVVGRQGRQQVEAGDAERMDHAVRAAGEHDVGLAVADHLGRLADGLAAGGTGGQAVVVGPFADRNSRPDGPASCAVPARTPGPRWKSLQASIGEHAGIDRTPLSG